MHFGGILIGFPGLYQRLFSDLTELYDPMKHIPGAAMPRARWL